MNPAQLDVVILGREYRVACREEEREALLEAVAFLDARMRGIRDGGKVAGTERIAVMAALNIAHELLRERKETSGAAAGPIDASRAAGRIGRMSKAIDDALDAQDKLF
ncbi:MAG: cell division protein ZapA [Burkholderiales bacterium]|nr:cell division protein ZapA [Burkholderiales bacterium]